MCGISVFWLVWLSLGGKFLSYEIFGDTGCSYYLRVPAMTNDATTNGHGPGGPNENGSTNFTVKAGLAKMLKGGVIMDVVNADQV